MKVRNRTVEKEEHMSRDRIDRLYEAIRRADQAYEVWAAAHGLTLYELQIYYEMMKNEGEAIRQKDLCLSLIHISEPTRQDRPSRMPSSA